MEVVVLGWPPDGPTLRLDYRRFSYAGKFMMSNTGKAVVREADEATDRGYDRVRIAVNNPFAYEALYRAGFGFTGEETGLAELVLERPADRPAGRDADAYRAGLDRFRARDLSAAETKFLDGRRGADPPGG